MLKFSLYPFDVLFFGSGKPFNFNVQETSSIFPPFPNTLAGAISNKISTEKGIKTSKIIKKLYGPFLEKNNEILFPKPLDILIEKKKKEGDITKVSLKNEFKLINPSNTDHPKLKALLWESKRNKEFETFKSFITLNGLKKWLNDQDVSRDDLVYRKDIFDFDSRVGIKMDYSRNVAEEEDAVYRINFVKLKDDIKIIFFVEFDYDSELKNCGLDNEDKIHNFFCETIKVLKLGGEMRNVSYEVSKSQKEISNELGFTKPEIKKGDIIKILYLTPGFLELNNSCEILTCSIESVNLATYTKDYGKKLKKGLTAGSVIYAKVNDEKCLENIWLNPKDGDFIGSNLRIYAKYKEG
ncbi:MAG: type III-B CRISPR module-associated protein Cmr3 [Candidatus Ratteibacteria bacterium]